MYTLSEAAKATGLNRSTLFRAIRAGRISATQDAQGQWSLDPAEVHRVYPPVAPNDAPTNAAQHGARDATPAFDAQIEGLKAIAELLRSQLADALSQRDKWQEAFQAQRLLAPPQSSATPEPKSQTWWRWLRSTG